MNQTIKDLELGMYQAAIAEAQEQGDIPLMDNLIGRYTLKTWGEAKVAKTWSEMK